MQRSAGSCINFTTPWCSVGVLILYSNYCTVWSIYSRVMYIGIAVSTTCIRTYGWCTGNPVSGWYVSTYSYSILRDQRSGSDIRHCLIIPWRQFKVLPYLEEEGNSKRKSMVHIFLKPHGTHHKAQQHFRRLVVLVVYGWELKSKDFLQDYCSVVPNVFVYLAQQCHCLTLFHPACPLRNITENVGQQ